MVINHNNKINRNSNSYENITDTDEFINLLINLVITNNC